MTNLALDAISSPHEILERRLREGFARCAGAFFILIALAQIHYDEVVSPRVDRWADFANAAAVEAGKRLSALSF
ncbi:MAG: hypothetical protein AB7O04_16085 [Hyphomonadaceae bacterium]